MSMKWPEPMATAEQLPRRLEGHPYSADVLLFDTVAHEWFRGSFQYQDISGDAGSWEVMGEVVQPRDVSHWVPLPPKPVS